MIKIENINWQIISNAVTYYSALGYKYIEAPWLVSESSISETFNGPSSMVVFDDHYQGELVGSAEQSFIEMMKQDKIKPGRYQAATPCFRMSDENISLLHFPYFFKVELIHILENNHREKEEHTTLLDCWWDAKAYFEQYGHLIDVKHVPSTQVDLYVNDVEIGSYGIRRNEYFTWIYGTGIAEPRFSMVTGGL